MFEYARPGGPTSEGPRAERKPLGLALPSTAVALDAIAQRKFVVLTCVALGAAGGWAATKIITPKFVATTQIYIDPGNLPGADKDALGAGQDSNGFINYVESQGVIIASRQVLQKVVADEKLDADPEFTGKLGPSLFSASAPSPADLSDSAIVALGARLQIRRPERTFVIDLSAFDKDPGKAARLANATAQAYIEVSTAMQRDAAIKAETSLSGRLVALRERVIAAEKAVESYKAENGLVGARDQLVTEQQLRELTTQMTSARARADEASALIDQIEANKKPNHGAIAALASLLNSASLSALRTQQAMNHAQLANLEGELGPRHPQVIEARARADASDRAVMGELARIARAERIEFQRAKQVEQTVGEQLEALKAESTANGERSVGLRDLERQAEAARGVYDLFVTRSRESGEIQQVEPPRTHVISQATAPKKRAFPPGASVMLSAGALVGALIGALLALWRQGVLSAPTRARAAQSEVAASREAAAYPPDPPTNDEAEKSESQLRHFAISKRTVLKTAQWAQDIARLDLNGLGIPVAALPQDRAEFFEMLDAATASAAPRSGRPFVIAVIGVNQEKARLSVSLNLALAARAQSKRVALFDATEEGPALTRAVRQASQVRRLTEHAFYRTIDEIWLAMPRISESDLARGPAAIFERLAETGVELVICDGPNLNRFRRDQALDRIDVILVHEDPASPDEAQETLMALKSMGLLGRALFFRFDPTFRQERSRVAAHDREDRRSRLSPGLVENRRRTLA